MIDGANVFDQPLKTILEHMISWEQLLLAKRMFTQLVAYLITHI